MNVIGDWKMKKVLRGDEHGLKYWALDDAYRCAEDDDERKMLTEMMQEVTRFCEDGVIKTLVPIPECVSEEEIVEAIESGIVEITDDHKYMVSCKNRWKEENGEIFINTEEENVSSGTGVDPWAKFEQDEDGLWCMMFAKYKKL